MSEKPNKPAADFLLDLITSDMNLAHAFTTVSRSAYQSGKSQEGDFARVKAIQLYSEAVRLVAQLPERSQESLLHELQVLSTAINWLFLQPVNSVASSSEAAEYLPLENRPIALEEN